MALYWYFHNIIRLALVIHIYSKFGTHIIIATSFVINCQRHNFLQSIELFLAPFIIKIINKRRYLCRPKGYIILSYQVRVWTLVNARRDDALFYEHVIEWCYGRTRAEPECASSARSRDHSV